MAQLVALADVKTRLTANISGSIPSGLTDQIISEQIAQNQEVVLNAFGVIDGDETKLSTSRQTVAKRAIMQRAVADCLILMFPTSETAERNAENMRKSATADIDRTLERASGADKPRTRLGVNLS